MRCPKCGNTNVMMESVGNGIIRASCSRCGWAEVNNDQGKRLLTEVPEVDKRHVLTEAT